MHVLRRWLGLSWLGLGPLRLSLALLLLMWVSLSGPAPAQAYEDQATVGVTAGLGLILDPDLWAAPTLGLTGSIGLGDVWTVRAFAGWAPHFGSQTLHVGWLGTELLYTFDIAQIVPFFGLGLDVFATLLGGRAGMEFGAHGIVGADYLIDREWAVGLDVRPSVLFLSAIESGRLDPVYITVNARFSYRFEL